MFEVIKSDDKSTGTNGNCVINLNDDISGEYRLFSFSFYNNLYNINSNNNRIVIADTNDVVINDVLLTNGDYGGNDLATLISNETYLTAVYSDITGKFTLTYSSDFKLLFGNYTKTAHLILGFENDNYTSDSNELVSQIAAQLLPYKNLYLNISENDNKPIKSQSHYFYSFVLVDKSSTFGTMFRYVSEQHQRQQKIHLKSSKKLQIKILDDKNNICNISDWVLILEK